MRVDDPREFIIDCLSDPANTEKQAALGQWLQQSAANRTLYAELRQLWDAAASMPPTPFNREEGWEVLSQQISDPSVHVVEFKREIVSSTREEAPAVTAPFLTFTKYAWVAASVVLIVLTGIYLWTAREQHIAIHALKIERVTLPDGSTIEAQPATTLEYDPAFTRRYVSLTQGEAYFSISPDEKRTFIVQLPRSTVTVLSTSFHVKVSGTTEKVDVREGKVRLTTYTDTLILTQGLAAQVTSAGQLLQPKLSFTNEEAGTVATALSAYFQVNITLPDSTFRKKKITANFQNMSAKEVQQVLNAILEQ